MENYYLSVRTCNIVVHLFSKAKNSHTLLSIYLPNTRQDANVCE